MDFDTANGAGTPASGEGHGFALQFEGRWFAVWSDGLQLVFQVGAQQWPMLGELHAVVKGETFRVLRDDEVVFELTYPHATYDPTEPEDVGRAVVERREHEARGDREVEGVMRIAVSGTHRVGKSTLVEALGEVLAKYATVAEPYELLEEDGYESATPPTAEDFEAQLECSLEALSDDQQNVIFDRCPADIVAYLSDSFDDDAWLDRVREAMQSLDLVVFVPIEARVKVESDDLRESVDEKLREILVDDSLGFGVEVLEVHGDVDARVRQVLARLKS